VRAISGQIAIILYVALATVITCVSNSDHMISNNNNMLSYVIRREERLTLKEHSLTADKCSWFEPTIRYESEMNKKCEKLI